MPPFRERASIWPVGTAWSPIHGYVGLDARLSAGYQAGVDQCNAPHQRLRQHNRRCGHFCYPPHIECHSPYIIGIFLHRHGAAHVCARDPGAHISRLLLIVHVHGNQSAYRKCLHAPSAQNQFTRRRSWKYRDRRHWRSSRRHCGASSHRSQHIHMLGSACHRHLQFSPFHEAE